MENLFFEAEKKFFLEKSTIFVVNWLDKLLFLWYINFIVSGIQFRFSVRKNNITDQVVFEKRTDKRHHPSNILQGEFTKDASFTPVFPERTRPSVFYDFMVLRMRCCTCLAAE